MADIAVLFRNGPHALATKIRYALKCSDVAVQVTKTPIQIPVARLSPILLDIGMFRPSITLTGIVDGSSVNTNTTKTGGDSVIDFEGMEIIPHTNKHVATTLTAASGTGVTCSVANVNGLQVGYSIIINGDTSNPRTISSIAPAKGNPDLAVRPGNITVTSGFQSNYANASVVEHTGQTLNYYIPYKNKLEDHIYTLVAENDINLELEVGAAEHHELLTHTHGSGSHTHGSTGGGIYQVAIQQARFQLNAAKEDRWDFTMQLVSRSREGYL